MAIRLAPRLRSPRAAANPLPRGTVAVAVGLVVAGVTTYAFLGLAARRLDADSFAALSALWALLVLAGPGCFLPVEQEVSRALAARRAHGLGARPVVVGAARLGGGLLAALLLVGVVAAATLTDRLFDGHGSLLVAVGIGLAGYLASHLARGVLSGIGRFGDYAVVLGAEGALRLAGCVVLVAVGSSAVGWYGLAVGLAPALAVALALRRPPALDTGPPASWQELSSSLGALLAGTLLTALLINAGPLAVKVLATEAEDELAGRFLAALLIARVPLFLFQAVQASLLPRLAALAAAGRVAEFSAAFRRLATLVAALAVAGTVGAGLLGPQVVRLLFGAEFDLGHRTLALLAGSSGLIMVAVTLGQALIALERPSRMALSWAVGSVAFLVVCALGEDLLLRVELALVAGTATAAAVMAASLAARMAEHTQPTVDGLVEALHDLPLEP